MLVNVNKVLTQYDGKSIMDGDKEATVREAIINAVLVPEQGDNGVAKMKKDELARKVYNAKDEVELTLDEVVLVKERVGEAFAPIIVGQVWRLLEGQ